MWQHVELDRFPLVLHVFERLLYRVLFAGVLGHFRYDVDVILEAHLETLAEREVFFRPHGQLELFGELLPVTITHARIAQRLYQWYVRSEFLHLSLYFNGHLLHVYFYFFNE